MATRPTMTIEHEALDDPMMRAATSLGELVEKSSNLTVTQERSLFGDIVIAQPIRVPRNEADILKKIDIMAAGAGTRWFYRYPVRNRRKGTTDYIEGPTIKCTDAVLMRYKNAAVESRTLPMPNGDFICYSRFCDWENGVSITMGQIVPKSATLGGEDDERRLQIAHNVGQSKSRRNVCVAAMGEFVQRGFQGAKKSLVDRIGRDIANSRKVIVEQLSTLGVPNIVARVEQTYARKQGDWLAADIAAIYAELQGIEDGFSSVDETWPLPAPPEPRRSDVENDTVQPASAVVPDRPVVETGPVAAQDGHPASPPVSGEPLSDIKETPTATADLSAGGPAAGPENIPSTPRGQSPDLSMPLEHWRVGDDVIGQENIITRLVKLVGLVETAADLDAIESENADRLAKITGVRRASLNNTIRAKRASLR